jgi:hypothetical protein
MLVGFAASSRTLRHALLFIYKLVANNMKKTLQIIIILLFLNSCIQETETKITLITSETPWVGYKDFYFQKELIICGSNSSSEIILTEKLNENDEIHSGLDKTDNRFIYSTRPDKAGDFKIKGKVITNGIESEFTQYIAVIPRMNVVGFNAKNAFDLKVGVENEIEIVIGVPKKYRTLKTDNGKIIETNEKTIIIPERVGKCVIELDVKMPSDEPFEFNDVVFNVTE